MNDDKLRTYQALATQDHKALITAAYARVHAWVGSPSDTEPRTCEEPLQFCDRIPPMLLGDDSTQTKDMSNAERNCPLHRVALVKDWLDLVVASTDFTASSLNYFQRAQVSQAIKLDRFTPVPEPTKEYIPDAAERHTSSATLSAQMRHMCRTCAQVRHPSKTNNVSEILLTSNDCRSSDAFR